MLSITIEQPQPRAPMQLRILSDGRERVRATKWSKQEVAAEIEAFLDYWTRGEFEDA